MIGFFKSRSKVGGLSLVLRALGLNRLTEWFAGQRSRRPQSSETPALDAVERFFSAGIAVPLLGLMKLGQRFSNRESTTTNNTSFDLENSPSQGSAFGVDPRWPSPNSDSMQPPSTLQSSDLNSLLQSVAERKIQQPPAAPARPLNFEDTRFPDFESFFGGQGLKPSNNHVSAMDQVSSAEPRLSNEAISSTPSQTSFASPRDR